MDERVPWPPRDHRAGDGLRVGVGNVERLPAVLDRRLLADIATIVIPDTILRWHRDLIAKKWTFERRGTGRPPVMKVIEDLVVRMAKENPTWGNRRVQGALANLGHEVAANTVKRILKSHGLEPAPNRKTTWAQFLQSHWTSLGASDFFTTEVWTVRGLVAFCALFAMRLKTRRIRIVGASPRPDALFMNQSALEMTSFEDSVLRDCNYVIIDRDSKFTQEFAGVFRNHGVKLIRIPPRSPNCNPYAERFVRSIEAECLDRLIFFGERSFRRALTEYEAHFLRERKHQGIDNRLTFPEESPCSASGRVSKRERLGGLLNYYLRRAA